MVEEILQQIEHLPPVPDVINELQEMFYMDAYNASDVEAVIKKDPSLVADILKIANSPIYGFVREILEIRQAIVLFGLDQVIEFALASFMDGIGEPDLKFYGIDSETFLKLAHMKSSIVKKLITDKKKRFLVANTAFLCDVSKVIISRYAKDHHITIQADSVVLNELDEIEREALGFDTIDVSIEMFDRWNFDPAMIRLLKNFRRQESSDHKALYIARDIVTIEAHIDQERLERLPQKESLMELVR